MKIWVFLARRPDDVEPTPVMYWGHSELSGARRMVETWPHRVSVAHEINVEPIQGHVTGQHQFEEGGQQGRCWRCGTVLESDLHIVNDVDF